MRQAKVAITTIYLTEQVNLGTVFIISENNNNDKVGKNLRSRHLSQVEMIANLESQSNLRPYSLLNFKHLQGKMNLDYFINYFLKQKQNKKLFESNVSKH
jgi:hypothetical protein